MMRSNYYLPQPHHTTDAYGHHLIDGETWFGGVRVPMMPNRIALLDLVTNTYLVLSHTQVTDDNPTSVIDLVTINPYWPDVTKVSEWYSGLWTLTLRNGVLGFTLGKLDRSAGLILTRRAYDINVLQLTPDVTGGVIYTPYSL